MRPATNIGSILARINTLLAHVNTLLAHVNTLLADVNTLLADINTLLADVNTLLAARSFTARGPHKTRQTTFPLPEDTRFDTAALR